MKQKSGALRWDEALVPLVPPRLDRPLLLMAVSAIIRHAQSPEEAKMFVHMLVDVPSQGCPQCGRVLRNHQGHKPWCKEGEHG